jgi:phage tail protein X
MSIYQGSRFIRTKLHSVSGETPAFAIRKRHRFDLTDATFYTWVQGDTIDGVAYRQYQNAQLWWAILDANPQYQSELDIKNGDVLVIPPYREVVRVCE